MKKIFTLIAMAMIAVASQAQSNDLQFCYEDGKVIADGSEVVVNTYEEDEDGAVMLESGIFIKNTAAKDVTASLIFNVSEITEESELSVCLGGTCNMYYQTGNYDISNVQFTAGQQSNMRCHWTPAFNWDTEEYLYGNCTGVYTLKSGATTCSTITVKFVYDANSAGIKAVDSNATVAKTYDLQGRETANAKGIVIQKMTDGTVRKVIK